MSKENNQPIWRTAIANSSTEGTTIRGYPLPDLISKLSFSDAIFLTLSGRLPDVKESELFSAMLIAPIDHGIAPPSAQAARLAVSGGASLSAAVATGLLTVGKYHGGAIEGAAQMLFDLNNSGQSVKEFVKASLEQKRRLPGLGHKIYSTDPRTTALIEKVNSLGLKCEFLDLAQQIEAELEKQKGKKLCLNVDGCLAALMLSLGLNPALGNGLFVIPRTVGLTAHAFEEMTREKPFKRLPNDQYVYDGEKERKL